MLERRTTSQGLVYYVSPLLERVGVKHAFSTRIGGVSPPPFDSMNLGNPGGCAVQDDDHHIAQNYRLLQSAIGCADHTRLWVHQVHGGNVAGAMRGETFENGIKADAIVSNDPAKLLAVRVADCVPVLIAGSDGAIVAAVHAGWRGVIAGVVTNAINKMIAAGARTESLVVAVGPGISENVFEIGPEVIDEFQRVFGSDAPTRRTADGKGRVDLQRAITIQLNRAGVLSSQIDATDRCTFRDQAEFFSHRRDRGITGRMAALIAARSKCPGLFDELDSFLAILGDAEETIQAASLDDLKQLR
ncbi:MAG TPA: peptidoglycan editing factor PgeF [Tepidisphaeraceae bacterium]|jgi:hypothetical protein|nr:peptidoglycan editing factor PgeF [Tepidisphaeraceae bacterium]